MLLTIEYSGQQISCSTTELDVSYHKPFTVKCVARKDVLKMYYCKISAIIGGKVVQCVYYFDDDKWTRYDKYCQDRPLVNMIYLSKVKLVGDGRKGECAFEIILRSSGNILSNIQCYICLHPFTKFHYGF